MNILVIHDYYQQFGGENLAVDGLLSVLKSQGHRVRSYTRDNREIERYQWAEKAAFIPQTFYSPRTYREVRAILENERPDIVQLRNIFPLISPSIYSALNDAHVPYVQFLSNFRLLCPNGLFYTRNEPCERCLGGNMLHAIRLKCYRESYTLSALYAFTLMSHRWKGTFRAIPHFLTPSAFVADKIVEGGIAARHKITVIPNFLPYDLPAPGIFGAREPYIVFLGRLSDEKGAEVAIRAMTGQTRLKLKIVGNGPLKESLQKLAADVAGSQVEFLGHLEGETKWNLLRDALVTVIPSVCYEVFPIVIMESMAAGTPLVVSRLGSLPYLVEEGKTGRLFESRNSEDLKEKLNWFFDHPQERIQMAQNGRAHAEREFTLQAGLNRLLGAYERVTREMN